MNPVISALREKGVQFIDASQVSIGSEVDPDRVSSQGVVIFPGSRIYGAKTVISAGCVLGEDGPVTVEDCQLGPKVRLKGGSFRGSVFLEGASVGPDAQVREGCLLEEQASAAHCVGLKQTILFPFATLGSLINFCDCLLAGGTSRKAHSEVGSSYIHFNFTPDGDKATASLFGDVPRGVMLDQPPIFLGGQGGAVGPVRVGFGTVVAAGGILREDVGDKRFVVPPRIEPQDKDVRLLKRRGHRRIIENNILYLANLVALEEWYRHVRRPFFLQQELGMLVLEGALGVLEQAKKERARRLVEFAALVRTAEGSSAGPAGSQLESQVRAAVTVLEEDAPSEGRDIFLAMIAPRVESELAKGSGYVAVIQGLTPEVRELGVAWLEGVVKRLCTEAAARAPLLRLWT